MKVILCVLCFMLPQSLIASDIEWVEDDNGIEFSMFIYKSKYKNPDISVSLIKVDLTKFKINVADISSVANKYQSNSYGLDVVLNAYTPVVVINGGYSHSFTSPQPAGLLKVDGKVYSNILDENNSPLSGVICISDNQFDVMRVEEYSDEHCDSALQAGPWIVEKGHLNGINVSQSKKISERSVLCRVDKNILILVQTSDASLYELGEMFGGSVDDGEMQCDYALNLDGSGSSGMTRVENGITILKGASSSVIASAIYITEKEPNSKTGSEN